MKNRIIICLMMACSISLTAQSFYHHSDEPFGIQSVKPGSVRAAQNLHFIDFDGDGDLDLFITGLDYVEDVKSLMWQHVHFFVEMQENIGTKYQPQFAERMENFDMFPYPRGYFFLTPGDLNDDGNMDFITSADIDVYGGQTLELLTNTGMPGAEQFEIFSLDLMDLPDFAPESFFKPHLVDLDLDGDLDLMNSGFESAFDEDDGPDIPTFYYARNVGDAGAALFEGWYGNPYGLVPDPHIEMLTSGDLDLDGDVDFLGSMMLIPSDSISPLLVHLNMPGSNGKPAFGPVLRSPFGMPAGTGDQQMLFPSLADIDGDGDLDLFVYEGTASTSILRYYENTQCNHINEELFICEGDVIDIGGTLISVAGEYYIDVGSTGPCDSILHLTVMVEALPTVDQEATICFGESYTIGNETFTEAGDYMVFLIAANGCDSIINLSLEVHDEIDAGITQSGEVLIATQGGLTYQWVNCDTGEDVDGATDQFFEVITTGSYGVEITDVNGCTARSECIQVMITSIKENPLSHLLRWYPNPTHDFIYLENLSSYKLTSVSVIDPGGKMIIINPMNTEGQIDLSSIAPGLYFLRVQLEGLVDLRKIVVH